MNSIDSISTLLDLEDGASYVDVTSYTVTSRCLDSDGDLIPSETVKTSTIYYDKLQHNKLRLITGSTSDSLSVSLQQVEEQDITSIFLTVLDSCGNSVYEDTVSVDEDEINPLIENLTVSSGETYSSIAYPISVRPCNHPLLATTVANNLPGEPNVSVELLQFTANGVNNPIGAFSVTIKPFSTTDNITSAIVLNDGVTTTLTKNGDNFVGSINIRASETHNPIFTVSNSSGNTSTNVFALSINNLNRIVRQIPAQFDPSGFTVSTATRVNDRFRMQGNFSN